MIRWREKKCNGLIYLLTSKTENKNYIGLTRRKFTQRINGHKKEFTRNRGTQGSLQEAIRKYGFGDFTYKIIYRAKTLGELSDKEREFIEIYGSLKPNGYNHNRGGSVALGGKPFEFMDEVFMSLADLADHYNIYEETLRKRIHAGWTMEQATELTPAPEVKRGGKHWQFDGYEFSSTNELCEYFQIDPLTFKVRLTTGLSVQQACGLVDRDQNTIVFENKEYSSIKELSEAYNLKYGRVSSRLAAGHSLEYAMASDEDPHRFGKKPIEINGKMYVSKAEAARQLGYTRGKLEKRLEYLDDSKSTAKLTELKKIKYHKKDRDLFVEGRNFSSIMDLSRHYKIPESTIRFSLNRGESIEKAVGLISEKNLFPLEFDGRIFVSQTEIAAHYGVDRATFSYRMKSPDWTLRQALGLDAKSAKGTEVRVDGRDFPSNSAVARYFSIGIQTFKRRLRDGWSMEEACNLKPRTKPHATKKVYVVTHPNGKEETIANLSAFCRENKLKNIGNLHITLKSKVNHSYKGFRLREANAEEITDFLIKNPTALAARSNFKSRHPVIYKGKNYRSKKHFCEEMKISYKIFCDEMNFGKSLEEAFEHCLKKS